MNISFHNMAVIFMGLLLLMWHELHISCFLLT